MRPQRGVQKMQHPKRNSQHQIEHKTDEEPDGRINQRLSHSVERNTPRGCAQQPQGRQAVIAAACAQPCRGGPEREQRGEQQEPAGPCKQNIRRL